MQYRGMWLVPWILCLAFAVTGCAGRKVATQSSKPEAAQAEEVDPIKIDANPRIAVASLGGAVTVRLTILVDPNPKNSWLEWSWYSEEGEGGADGRTIDGSSQRRFTPFINLATGNYNIEAKLVRGEEVFTAKTDVKIVGDER